jgi:hypothetical protein
MKEIVEHKRSLRRWINPAKESLWSKLTTLEETLSILGKAHLSPSEKEILQRCEDTLENARACFVHKWWQAQHPHLAWEFMHRVDEDIILLLPADELYSRAVEIKTYFDLNITEKKIREEWIGKDGGEKGKLIQAIKNIENMKDSKASERDIHVVKQALSIINQKMDRTFWQLSMNTQTKVLSGLILGALMTGLWRICFTSKLSVIGSQPSSDFLILALLGLMGGYLSNVMTKEDFLYVRGGPFWVHLIHHIAVKPILSAFAAAFVYLIEKSKLIFSISTPTDVTSNIVILKVGKDVAGYAYALLAVVSGFASDKLLRDMIDGVLRKLEQKAEKTKETKQEKG